MTTTVGITALALAAPARHTGVTLMVPLHPSLAAGAPLHALLVEPHPTDSAHLLREIGQCAKAVQIETAATGRDALHRLANRTVVPHVAFVDLGLADIPATELLLWLRCHEEYARIWLIAVTRELRNAARPARDFGADALLVKPVALADLAAVLMLVRTPRAGLADTLRA